MLKKTWMVVAGFCLMATTALAQMPQVRELPTQKMAPARISMEQLKGIFEVAKMQHPSMKMGKVNLSNGGKIENIVLKNNDEAWEEWFNFNLKRIQDGIFYNLSCLDKLNQYKGRI